MSQIVELETAWHAYLVAAAARTGSNNGTATAGTTKGMTAAAIPAPGWPATEDHYQWATVLFLTGANTGRFRAVESYSVAGGVASFGWRAGLPSAVSAGDTFSVSFAPLGGATVYLRQVIPASMEPTELPAVFVAGQRSRTVEDVAVGNRQGSRLATVWIRTDLVSPWSDDTRTDLMAQQLHEQLDQIRLGLTGLPGVAHIGTPTREEEVCSFAELDVGQRVYWSVLWTPFQYWM